MFHAVGDHPHRGGNAAAPLRADADARAAIDDELTALLVKEGVDLIGNARIWCDAHLDQQDTQVAHEQRRVA